METEKTVREEIVLTHEEKARVRKGIRWSQVVSSIACVLADSVRVLTKLECGKRPEEIQKDIDKLKRAITDYERLSEMFKKHPIHD